MRNKEKSLFLWLVLLMLSNNNLVLPVFSNTNTNFGNEKNYYSPTDPHVPTPSSGVQSRPTHHESSHKHQGSSSPNGQSNCRTPTSPSRGGSGGSYHPPRHTPINPPSGGGCRCPSPPPTSGGSGGYYPPTPSTPTPIIINPPKSPLVPSPPSGSGGSGGYYPPTPPTIPLVPSPPSGSGGSGGYYPPTPRTPSSPLVPSPPSSGGGGGAYYPPTPTTPTTPSSPFVPSPVTPTVPSPYLPVPTTPPRPFDPSTPPFPCTYWGSHPGLVFGLLGWWATVGGVFGVATLPGLNSATSLQEMLTNPRNDGYGSLYREASASFLNSMASKEFPYSTKQVKDAFLASLSSNKAAAAQARLFKLANEKKLKPATSHP